MISKRLTVLITQDLRKPWTAMSALTIEKYSSVSPEPCLGKQDTSHQLALHITPGPISPFHFSTLDRS